MTAAPSMPQPAPAAAEAVTPAASPAAPARRLTGSWTGHWGGRPIHLQLLQFEHLVVGDLRIEGRRLSVRGEVDARGVLGWTSIEAPAVPHYQSAGGWRLVTDAGCVGLGGGLRRRLTTVGSDGSAGIGVLQAEARLRPVARAA